MSRFRNLLQGGRLKRGALVGGILLAALICFELANYVSTNLGLRDILGNISIFGFRWATLLSFAFCAVDFAGLARIFTPEQGRDEPAEVWYLLGAWFLAAVFDAFITWWSVTVAIATNPAPSAMAASRPQLMMAVPIGVAILELLVRITLISTFSLAGDRIFSTAESSRPVYRPSQSAPSPVTSQAIRSGSTIRQSTPVSSDRSYSR